MIKPENISQIERDCARQAVKAIEDCGGIVTFRQYDKTIRGRAIFPPINWCEGWNDPIVHRRNTEKLSVFAAVALGWVIASPKGYTLPAD